jgi:hypothetical protein
LAIRRAACRLSLQSPALSWTVRRNEGLADCGVSQPAHDLGSGEFGAIVRPYECKNLLYSGMIDSVRITSAIQAGTDLDRSALIDYA